MISPNLILTDHELLQLTDHERDAYQRALVELENTADAEQLLAAMPLEKRRGFLEKHYKGCTEVIQAMLFKWHLWRREKQVLPEGDWATWLILAGRGNGKTRTGSETVREWVKTFKYVNLIGPTADDIRDAMVEGESGILAVCPADERPYYAKSDRKLKWPNGSTSLLFSAQEPERLRNKQSMKIWADEICLVAGTLVQTNFGEKPIETLKSGDLVATRQGFRVIKWSQCTRVSAEVYRLTTSDGRTLVGTSNHPVWVEGVGFKPLAELNSGDVLLAVPICTVTAVTKLPDQQAVYNLEVEGCPEYFANGILTHNCAWQYPDDTWSNAMFGLRLGSNPQALVTTTPKPIKIIRDLLSDPATLVTRGTTFENRKNLAEKFFQSIVAKYENTRLGRQELNAEVLDDNPGALWTVKVFDDTRVKQPPKHLRRVVIGIDPAVTSNDESDEWGIVVCGEDDQSPPHYYVLEDTSAVLTPDQACEKALYLYSKWDADRIVAEVNNGGDMIESLLRTKQHAFAYEGVRATRGKYVRAEPIAALYEQGRAHHVGYWAALESQMADYVPGLTKKSPDRLDACVWSMTVLAESGLHGGWLLDSAKKAREDAADVSPKTTDELAAAQKRELRNTVQKSGVFGEDKTMGGKVLTTKLAKPQVNSKTPACPNCGNQVLVIAGDFRKCNQCGWDNKIRINEYGAPLQKVV